MTKRRGSALIVAILLMALVGGIAFSTGRLVFLESGSATLYEKGIVAYYAAESGIEEGLFRYRYDKNAEVPQSNWTVGDTKVYRNNISNATQDTGVSKKGIDPSSNSFKGGQINPAEMLYDLRLGYAGTGNNPWYGQENIANPATYSTSTSYTFIAQDNTKKIDLSSLVLSNSKNSLTLYGKFINATDPCQLLIELTLTVKYAGATNIKQYKDFLASSSSCSPSGIDNKKLVLTDSGISSQNYTFTASNIDRTILANAGAPIPTGNDQVSLTIKPLYKGLVFGLSTTCKDMACASMPHDHTNSVPGPYTTISSTGYFGGISRKIIANIDRESGTLYDLYDYVLFNGN